MLFVQDDKVVEALAPERPDDPLDHGIGARGSDRREQRLGAKRLSPRHELRAIGTVSVPDQILRCCSPRSSLDELLPDPHGGRVRGDIDMDKLALIVGDEPQHEEGLEGQSRDSEQVGRPNLRPMISQEGSPSLTRWAGGSARAVTPDRTVADGDSQLEKFTADPLGAPVRIVTGSVG